MKLKNKLLPLVGVATACAAVAPIATSCKSSTSDMVDLMQLYKPTITMYSDTTDAEGKKIGNIALDQDAAIEAYFGSEDGWTDDATIQERIKQDYYWSKSFATYFANKKQSKQKENVYTVINNQNINYVKIGHETVRSETGSNYVVPTLSMQIEYQRQRNKSKDAGTSTVETTKGMVTITNLPVCVYNTTISSTGDTIRAWGIRPDWDEIDDEYSTSATTQTKVSFFYIDEKTVEEAITEDGITTTKTYSSTTSYYPALINGDDEEIDAFREDYSNYNFASYYLYGNGVKK